MTEVWMRNTCPQCDKDNWSYLPQDESERDILSVECCYCHHHYWIEDGDERACEEYGRDTDPEDVSVCSFRLPHEKRGPNKPLNDILRERARQDAKWGEQNYDPPVWMTILMEEVGEASECVLHEEFGGSEAQNLREEVVQIAAVAVAFLEFLDRRAKEEAFPAQPDEVG